MSATKWLTDIELTTTQDATPYWVRRGWAPAGPIKTQTRIDVPRPGTSTNAGPVVVAGIAWSPTAGIARVEVRVDDGAWQQTVLGRVPSADTWVQWHATVDVAPGDHTLRVRSTDGNGTQQPERRTAPFPDGAEGWHAVPIHVTG